MNTEDSAGHNTDHISREKINIKPDELQQAIEQAAVILKAAGADAVYLFGSTVEGRVRADSDIDLIAQLFEAYQATICTLNLTASFQGVVGAKSVVCRVS
jgi:predicted nucleotidyltransferase